MSLSRKQAPAKPKSTTSTSAVVPTAVPASISQVQRDKGTPQAATTPQKAADIPEELIAARAYEIWQQRGAPVGEDGCEDWYAARDQLEQERLGWASPRASDKQRGV